MAPAERSYFELCYSQHWLEDLGESPSVFSDPTLDCLVLLFGV